MEQPIDINKYIYKFSIVYAIGLIALTAIFNIFDINHSSGVSIAILIAAAMYTVGKFIEENKRTPNKKEKSKLVWSSLIVSWVLSIILAIVIVLALNGTQGLFEISKLAEQLNIIVIAVILFVVSLLYFAVLSWSYGGLAKKQFEGLQKKGKI